MAGSESQLKKMVSKYKYINLAVCETVKVFTLYKDLKRVLDSYVFNDGSSRELMNLTGTIPVPYRGTTYISQSACGCWTHIRIIPLSVSLSLLVQ